MQDKFLHMNCVENQPAFPDQTGIGAPGEEEEHLPGGHGFLAF